MRSVVAASAIAAASGFALELAAQERAPASDVPFVDPTTGRDPFVGDGGASATADVAAPSVDPTIGPDPFDSDAGTTPAPIETPPATAAPVAPAATPLQVVPPSGSPPVATVLPPNRREPEDDDAIVFGGRHAKVRLTLLIQPQLAWEFFNAAASPNAGPDGTLPQGVGANATFGRPDGSTTNRGTFRLRRARLGLELTTLSPFAAAIEIDPNLADRENPASGTIARRFELMARSARELRRGPPRYEFGAGLFYVPFSRDLLEAHGERVFVERAYGTRAMIPEDADIGVRLRRAVLPLGLTVDLAVVNGVAVGEPTFGRAPDLNKTKDAVGHVAIRLPRFEAGLGGYVGQGQAVDPQSFRVLQRSRAAIEMDALFRARFGRAWPETRLVGEVVVGRNMDRGVLHPFVITLPQDPTQGLPNFDSRSAWVRLEQDFRGGTVAFRYDAYTPDATATDDTRHTLAFAVARSIGRHARLSLEYDHVVDQIHAPTMPSFKTKIIDVFSAMGQLRY